ncbi:MAG: hypothetical protein COB53_03275 [Elusimicrobia bacterium]|nr:MAG: hypothetical protein COB53_03275 [Elusimicrobiota bacterium]
MQNLNSDTSEVYIQTWEWQLVLKVTNRFRTRERDELFAVLSLHVLELKRAARTGIEDWRPYLRRSLHHRAIRFVREEKALSTLAIQDSHSRVDKRPGPDFKLAFDGAWEKLSGKLKKLWLALADADGNQVEAAQKLGVHRNTVKNGMEKIVRILEENELGT